MKKCRICGENKDFTEFYRRIDSSDGLNSVCKKCYCITQEKDFKKRDIKVNPDKYFICKKCKSINYKRKVGGCGNSRDSMKKNCIKCGAAV